MTIPPPEPMTAERLNPYANSDDPTASGTMAWLRMAASYAHGCGPDDDDRQVWMSVRKYHRLRDWVHAADEGLAELRAALATAERSAVAAHADCVTLRKELADAYSNGFTRGAQSEAMLNRDTKHADDCEWNRCEGQCVVTPPPAATEVLEQRLEMLNRAYSGAVERAQGWEDRAEAAEKRVAAIASAMKAPSPEAVIEYAAWLSDREKKLQHTVNQLRAQLADAKGAK